MAEADWLIDLGPEGGDGGGRVVAEARPRWRWRRRIAYRRHLREFLAQRKVG